MVWRPSGEVESMGWIRKTRRPDRCRRSLEVEALEVRNLLSASPRIHHHTAPVAAHHHKHAIHPAAPLPTTSADVSTPNNDGTGPIGAAQARAAYGVDGTGATVAVIDTGVNYQHEALGK